MDLLAIEHARVIERLGDAGIEIGLATRLRAKAALARLCVAHGCIEQHDFHPRRFGAGSDLTGGEIIWRLELDGAKAGFLRCRKAIEKRQLGEKRTDISREIRHRSRSP